MPFTTSSPRTWLDDEAVCYAEELRRAEAYMDEELGEQDEEADDA